MKSPDEWAEILRRELKALEKEFYQRGDLQKKWLHVVAETFREAIEEAINETKGHEEMPRTP